MYIPQPAVQQGLLYEPLPVRVSVRPWPIDRGPVQLGRVWKAPRVESLPDHSKHLQIVSMGAIDRAMHGEAACYTDTATHAHLEGPATMARMLRACAGANLSSA